MWTPVLAAMMLVLSHAGTEMLPPCSDAVHSDEQIDAAIRQAERDLGLMPTSLNDPAVIHVWWRMAEILGCSLPAEQSVPIRMTPSDEICPLLGPGAPGLPPPWRSGLQ